MTSCLTYLDRPLGNWHAKQHQWIPVYLLSLHMLNQFITSAVFSVSVRGGVEKEREGGERQRARERKRERERYREQEREKERERGRERGREREREKELALRD